MCSVMQCRMQLCPKHILCEHSYSAALTAGISNTAADGISECWRSSRGTYSHRPAAATAATADSSSTADHDAAPSANDDAAAGRALPGPDCFKHKNARYSESCVDFSAYA